MEELKALMLGMNENLNKKLDNLSNDMAILMKKDQITEKRLKVVEKEIIKRNLIIFGIQEGEENYWELENRVINVLNNIIDNFTYNDVDFIYRLGKREENQNRPIKIGLIAWRKKLEILGNTKKLKGTSIYIEEDLPKDIRDQNKELIPLMIQKRKEGKFAIVRNGKLITKDREDKQGNKSDNRIVIPGTSSESIIQRQEVNKKRNLSDKEEEEIVKITQKFKEDTTKKDKNKELVGKLRQPVLDYFTRGRSNSIDSVQSLGLDTLQSREDLAKDLRGRGLQYNK